MMPSRNMDPGECMGGEDEVPQAMAFTVTFDSAKTTNNKFIKRHIRNLSLPITKVYDNKPMFSSAVNGKPGKRQGNQSDGYFSSDPDDDHPQVKLNCETKNFQPKGRVTPDGAAEESHASMNKRECRRQEEVDVEDDDEEEGASDVASETGTYTIKKESPEVITARLSIDANFGIDQGTSSHETSREWVNEWTTQVINHKSYSHSVTETHSKAALTRTPQVPSKIPSPLTTRARFGIKSAGVRGKEAGDTGSTSRTPILGQRNKATEECSDSETEKLLKTTEKVMSALAARLSLDSGGESEGETRRCGSDGKREGSGRASDTKSTLSTPSTRYNRTFSLRRGRLENSGSVKSSGTSPPPSVGRGSSGTRKTEAPKPHPLATPSKPKTSPHPTNLISRIDTGRFSMRASKPIPQSPSLSGGSGSSGGKKPSGGRSNSTLSSKEVEFQNWKRRKSYDPMKAAAEGRKKEAASKRPPTSTSSTPKSPVNSVWRSASFHGTRQLGGVHSSSDDEEDTNLSCEEDDWPVPQGPKTSLQNSPQGSKGSLYSSSSNNSPHARQNLEGVDILLVSALYRLANKQKGTASCILKKLRCLYDEESHKYKLITSALEQLEQSEPSGSPHMSPSRELASTLTVSKKLNATFRILNEVLFDEVDLE